MPETKCYTLCVCLIASLNKITIQQSHPWQDVDITMDAQKTE